MASGKAAFVNAAGERFRIDSTPIPTPGPKEVIIKNHAVAINPIDNKRKAKGVFVKSWPTVLGSDVAGEIYEVGSSVSNFKKGDRVVGYGWGLLTNKIEDGAFQLYTKSPAQNTAHLPDSIGFHEAAVIPLGLTTAACGLFKTDHFGLPQPFESTKASDKTVIIYGASSSVGINAVQLATASGVHVVALASKRNFDLVKSAGAKEVYDYSSSSTVEEIISSVKSSKNTFVGVFDTIGNDGSFKTVVPLVEKLGGKYVTTQGTPENLPEGSNGGRVFGIGDWSFDLWTKFVPEALKDGRLKPLPQSQIVGKGLESFEEAIGLMEKGVSGKKLVVDLA